MGHIGLMRPICLMNLAGSHSTSDIQKEGRFIAAMEILRGIPVSHGVALGPALVLDAEGFRIPHQHVAPEQVEQEISRLKEALTEAAAEARETQAAMAEKLGKKYGAIFAAHALLFDDPSLIG